MTVEFDTKKIQGALQDFYNATGIDVELIKEDFTSATQNKPSRCQYCAAVHSTPDGRRACQASDRALLKKCAATGQTQSCICHAGLVDVALPILYEQQIIGYLIFGRMKTNLDFSFLEEYIAGLGLDVEKAKEAYGEIPFYDADRIQSVSNIATLLCKYILLENMLRPKDTESLERATAYIRENLHKPLSVQNISRGAGVSKSVLYKAFHQRYNCTVSDYIKTKRVECSLSLLTETQLSMEEISQRIGFSSASYYSKVFKAQKGISPLKYRKENAGI